MSYLIENLISELGTLSESIDNLELKRFGQSLGTRFYSVISQVNSLETFHDS